ncbi:hypothetical protein M0805_004308 [Coniferiporia weirii]|nr:hypothetical protein M0805_004308 [Coniferiporia weirii]
MYASASHVQPTHHPSLPNGHPHHVHQSNGHHHHHHHHPHPQPGPSHRPTAPPASKDPLRVLGIPSIAVNGGQLIYGDAQSSSERVYAPIKVVGDGSFGTVWLADWHSALPPNTQLSPMQCGAGARPEWAGKRLVALKRMKKRWEGGWDECRKLKELESLRAIPFHPNIIPLYDFFLLPSTKELYFVFEPMEGNLYQLIKSRKGRPLAGGLASCIFRQVVSGLDHIHAHGYFHRDMKPENLLVTTTGLFDYRNVSPVAPPNAPPEKDVVVIVKLADFGLARETKSKPPYTEYVSTRWYRAPEVLLRSRDYSNPVDMWALGTIMAELINLKPLFPGQTEIDQVARICEILGDPSDEYGVDARGTYNGGGKWVRGIKMARAVGYQFPKLKPVPFHSLFDRNVPYSLIECISDLLKYDPDMRLTCRQCLEHTYIQETTAGNIPPGPQVPLQINTSYMAPVKSAASSAPSVTSQSPRTIPPSHSNSPANGKPMFNGPQHVQPQRRPFFPQVAGQVGSSRLVAPSQDLLETLQIQHESSLSSHNSPAPSSVYVTGSNRIADGWADGGIQSQQDAQHGDWEDMDVLPMSPPSDVQRPSDQEQPMDIAPSSPSVLDDPSKRLPVQDQATVTLGTTAQQSTSTPKLKLGLSFGKSRSKGVLGMFGLGDKGHQSVLPPVDELNVASSSSVPSLKRTQSSSTDSRSLSELSPVGGSNGVEASVPMDAKTRKKEAERIAMEAEKSRRALAEKRSREQARAVIQKRNQMIKQKHGADFDWDSANATNLLGVQKPKSKQRTNGTQASSSSATINAAGGRFRGANEGNVGSEYDNYREVEHRTKARRRDLDDDHSMSSSDLQSVNRLSVISFATVESDPLSSRLRHRPSLFGITRMQSSSSLRTSFGDDFSNSARSSDSPSFEHPDFDSRASMSSYEAARSSMSEASSPLPMHSLSISSPQHQAQALGRQPFISLSPMSHQHLRAVTPSSPYEYGQYGQIQAQPPSPAIAPHSAINPIFKVPPLPPQPEDIHMSHNPLPPFSELESIAEPLPPFRRTEDP